MENVAFRDFFYAGMYAPVLYITKEIKKKKTVRLTGIQTNRRKGRKKEKNVYLNLY